VNGQSDISGIPFSRIYQKIVPREANGIPHAPSADTAHRPDREEAGEFMDTMHLLAAVAKTRTVDPETGLAGYAQLPRRPHGAPADYIRVQDVMRKVRSGKLRESAP